MRFLADFWIWFFSETQIINQKYITHPKKHFLTQEELLLHRTKQKQLYTLAVESMDFTRSFQETRSFIAVAKSHILNPVSLLTTSGKVSFLNLSLLCFGFHNKRVDIISEVARWQWPANWARFDFKSDDIGFREPYIISLVGWSLQERFLTLRRSLV